MTKNKTDKKLNKTVVRLVLVSVLMFGFGFALVPLYEVFCDVTGLNGKTATKAAVVAGKQVTDDTRHINIQFTTTVNADMPWEFKPQTYRLEVVPGKMNKVFFVARNKTENEMVGQAVPSITPGLSAKYFKKTECFCFNRQVLAGKEMVEMPMVFMIDPELPAQYKTITLSYTLFDAAKFTESNIDSTRKGRLTTY